jgi:hypothetical protein
MRLCGLALAAAIALGALSGFDHAPLVTIAQADNLEQCQADCQERKDQCINRAQAAIDRDDAYSIPDCNDDCHYQIRSGCASRQQFCEQDCESAAAE